MPKHARNTATAKAAAEKRRAALELRLAGYDYREIARRVGYSGPGAAYKAVSRALDAIPKASATEYRREQIQRLYAMHKALWPRAMEGDAEATRTLNQVHAALDRYIGFDAASVARNSETDHVGSLLHQLLENSL